jgi:hypothetical protein
MRYKRQSSVIGAFVREGSFSATRAAIIVFQLAQPYMGTRNMSRLATRRGPGMKLTLSVAEGGETSVGTSRSEAGLSIGDGYLGRIARESAPLMTSETGFGPSRRARFDSQA